MRPRSPEGIGENPEPRLPCRLLLLRGEDPIPFPVAQEQRHASRSIGLVAVGKDISVAPGAGEALVVPGETQPIEPVVHAIHQRRIAGDRVADLHGTIASQGAEALGHRLGALEAARGR